MQVSSLTVEELTRLIPEYKGIPIAEAAKRLGFKWE